MTLFAVIPVKPFTEGKSRLKDVLADDARRDLNRRMFAHVLDMTVQAVGAGATIVVSADREARDAAEARGATPLREKALAGLNAALTSGVQAAAARGADAVLVLPTDLPTLSRDDLEALLRGAGPPPCVVIAPDRHGRGTNALLIAPPDAVPPSFGPNSFSAHRRAAAARCIEPVVVRRDGLAFDMDTPDDYRELMKRGWDSAARRD